MDDTSEDRLQLILAEAKRVQRSARILGQLAARELDRLRSNDNSDSQEAHANDTDRN